MTGLTAVSLFGGIEGFGLALERCGVNVVASVEIDPDCRAVTARHFPETRLFDDVRTVTGNDLIAAGFVPGRGILTGGFPCQDLSIAGRRIGLGGARSGLFWEIMRLADELSPRWLLLENVPGIMSAVCHCPGDDTCTDNGRAVRCGEWRDEPVPGHGPEGDECPACGHGWDYHDAGGFCAFCSDTCAGFTPVPFRKVFIASVPHGVRGGACATGCMAAHGGAMGTVLGALGERGYGFAYRVLDSQFLGVPQRRERVFFVGCLGDGAAPVEVLLEPEGSQGNPAARGEARQGASRSAGQRSDGSGITGTLTTGMLGDYDDNTARAGFMVACTTGAGWWREGAGTLRAEGGGTDQGGHLVVAPTITAGWGTNHGAPGHGGKDGAALAVIAATLQGGGRRGHRIDAEGAAGGHLIPFSATDDTAYALTSRASRASRASREETYIIQPETSAAITAHHGKGPDSDATNGLIIAPSVAHALTSEGADASEDGTGRGTPLVPYSRPVPSSLAVRRLTPRECERLQAFPDITRALRIEVRRCSDRPRNPALADYQSPRSQKPASNVGAPESWNPAQPAESHSRCFRPDLGLPVAASVHIDCEASAAEVRSPDGRRWSVNGAALKDPSPLAVLLDVSARLHALTPHGQARATSTGRAESPPSLVPSTHQPSGAICVPVCGLEIDGSADGAHECGLTEMSRSTFTTSRAGRTTQTSVSTWTTLCSSVLAAIGSFIPLPTPATTSYAVELTATAGWTRWKVVSGELVEQSDSARYRMIGNAVTVSVVQWIARRIVAHEVASAADEAGAA